MTINADILRSKFGFNDQNVINNILNDPGQVARYDREYQGMINPQPAAPPPVDTSKILRESSLNAINTLQSGAVPLEQRYGDLVGNIRQTTQQETGRADVTSARELAQRGISTNSTFAGEYQQSKRLPIETAGQGQEAAAQLSAQQAVENRNSAIAQIQSATGLNEVKTAMEAYRQSESSRQFNATLAFQKSEAEKDTSNPYDRYTSLSEGQTLYDLLTGEPLYKVPKTYKSGDDPY